MWLQADSDVSIPVEFLLNGQLVIPDVGSIKLTLRDNAGAIITGYDRVAQPDVYVTQMLLTIPAVSNALTQDAEFETRYGTVEFTSGIIPCFVKFSYNLVAFIPMSASPETVRSVLGVEYEELPDESIDVVKAYFDLKKDYATNFTSALTATSVSKLQANDAIACKAALNVFPSLQTRILASEKTDATEYIRLKVNLDKLQKDVEKQLENALTAIAQSSLVAPTLFMVSSPVDPVTNA